MKNNITNDVFTFKTRKEIAFLYGIHRDTLRKIMNENGLVIKRRLLSPKEQKALKNILN